MPAGSPPQRVRERIRAQRFTGAGRQGGEDHPVPTGVNVRAQATFTYTNLGTGATVTDGGRFVFTIEDAGATFVVRGLGVQM